MSVCPLYIGIYDNLLKRIKNGEFSLNIPLPTERELCEHYHVSRSTVRSALHELQKNEIIYTKQGSGTFIKSQLIEQQLQKFYSFTDELKDQGANFGCTIIDYQIVSADDMLAQKMCCSKGDLVHMLVRLRGCDSAPLMLEVTHLLKHRFPKLNISVLSNSSLYEYLRTKYGLHMDHCFETLQSILPSPHEKELLGVAHSIPCTLLERYSYEDNELVEYTRSVVRGDKYIFKVRLENNKK